MMAHQHALRVGLDLVPPHEVLARLVQSRGGVRFLLAWRGVVSVSWLQVAVYGTGTELQCRLVGPSGSGRMGSERAAARRLTCDGVVWVPPNTAVYERDAYPPRFSPPICRQVVEWLLGQETRR